jgi:uncharacterized protein
LLTKLGIFLKAPEPGRVKTRLAARLGPERAASLYSAFVLDVLSLAGSVRVGQRILWWAGAPPSTFLRPLSAEIAREAGAWPAVAQCEGDLGARLAAAFAAESDAPLLVLGTDSPDLPSAHLESAILALENGAEAVFGEAQDGGVWCIGLRRAPSGFFDALPWSSETTADALRRRARASGLAATEVDPWYDCDTAEDLDALAVRLRKGTSSATMTGRWLRECGDSQFSDPNPTRV